MDIWLRFCLIFGFQEAALRSFYIKDDPGNYYITEALEYEERPVDSSTPISILVKEEGHEKPSLFLRYRDKDPNKGFIKVYPGNLKYTALNSFSNMASVLSFSGVLKDTKAFLCPVIQQ